MSSTNKTNVTPLQITNNGINLPEESVILEDVIEDFQNAFDGKLKFRNANGDFLLSTPQGQLVTSIAAIISDRNRLLAHYVNQVDPNYAVGRMQDGIGRIYFLERKRATITTVVGRCYGVANTVIPAGTRVKDTQDNVYKSMVEGIIKNGKEEVLDDKGNIQKDADGNIITRDGIFADITFQCLVKGNITCPAGTLTERYQVIQGWESVTNLNDGIVGMEDESQAQFEQRRRQSVAHNSLNSVDSIMSTLLSLDEVEDAFVTENYEGESKKITDQLSLKPHSVYACVSMKLLSDETLSGDTNTRPAIIQKIAKEIWRKKTPGCDLNGSVVVNVKDDTTDINGKALYDSKMAPEYLIQFDFAHRVPIYLKVTVSKPKPIVGDPVTLIQNKLCSVFAGKDGSKKPRIGSQILASQFYCSVQSIGDWVKIVSIKVGIAPNPTNDIIQVSINEIPVLVAENIEVKFINNDNGASNG